MRRRAIAARRVQWDPAMVPILAPRSCRWNVPRKTMLFRRVVFSTNYAACTVAARPQAPTERPRPCFAFWQPLPGVTKLTTIASMNVRFVEEATWGRGHHHG